jgi:hypothetical protein
MSDPAKPAASLHQQIIDAVRVVMPYLKAEECCECHHCKAVRLLKKVTRPDAETLALQHHAVANVEAAASSARWISVNDQLPPKNKTVLVFDDYTVSGGGARVDVASLNLWGRWKNGWDEFHGVTHWAELPAPPQNIDRANDTQGVARE